MSYLYPVSWTPTFASPMLQSGPGLVRQHVFSASRDGTVRRLGLVAAWDRAGAGLELIR